MNAIQSLIAAGMMTAGPFTNTWTPTPFVPLDWVKVDKHGNVLPPNAAPFASDTTYPPGTPVEGSKLTTETMKLEPCFAAVTPACPGHWATNRTEWVFRSGKWLAEPTWTLTNMTASSNLFWITVPQWGSLTNNIQAITLTNTGATNFLGKSPGVQLEIEALEKQIEFWKTKALNAVR